MAISSHDEDDLQLLLSEQTHSFIMAQTLASDLNFAFQLQIQEAVNASIHSQTPSSPIPIPIPIPIPSDDDDDDNDDHENDDVLGLAATLLLQDTQRYPQELKDLEICRAEMRNTREDLHRRSLDQAFARDILNIPEEEWEKYGDYFQRPYSNIDGASSSSSSSSFSFDSLRLTKCLDVYSKGLVSEEWVNGLRVKVAAAGVCFCDSAGFVVFEVKKPLEVFQNGGELLSGECAELLAIIEGLEAALNLGLHSLTFSFDHYMLHQYITGRVQPSEPDKYASLLSRISHLQRKFVYCEPSLVKGDRNRCALKSAREAIISQIKWPAESEKGRSFKETCAICFEDTDVEKMFTVDHCLHRYCFSCMKHHVEAKLLNGTMAECPHEGCKSEVSFDGCKKFLAPELVEVAQERIKESAIPVTEKLYCPFPRCSALMSKHEALEYTKTAYVGGEEHGVRKCIKCRRFFCVNCKVPWHNNMTCDGYKSSNLFRQAGDTKLKSIASMKHWRQCVKCNHIIELAEGCYHITCRCGHEFCYTCGAKWENKKATCSCRIWDEHNIIRDRLRGI